MLCYRVITQAPQIFTSNSSQFYLWCSVQPFFSLTSYSLSLISLIYDSNEVPAALKASQTNSHHSLLSFVLYFVMLFIQLLIGCLSLLCNCCVGYDFLIN
jgi:hypothetical protein